MRADSGDAPRPVPARGRVPARQLAKGLAMTAIRGQGSGPALGDPVPHGSPELVYESDRTLVRRVPRPDGSGFVIQKEPLGPGSDQRRRHETAVLERLAGVEGVTQLAAVSAGPDVIMLDDLGGTSLQAAPRPDPEALIDLAYRLAKVIAAVHRHGVVHKDISPANIVLAADGTATLIDFELATTFAEERPGFTHQSQIAGTLAYIAPEQTGRTGGAVDQRADLYSFGATLYELATGRPPFGDGEPLQLIHDHLAVVPPAPAELDPATPRGLSDIIMRLLEKEPDRRYQSAVGLAYDLALVRDRRAAGDPAPVTLGERDFPLRLAPPSRLVGRDREIAALRTAFADAVRGSGRGLLITGPPGVGKTALIDELRPVVTAAGGWFVTGKFDQNRNDVTSDAVGQALAALCRLLLAEPEDRLAALRTRIARVLGPHAGLMASLLPDLALLLELEPGELGGDPVDAEARLFQGSLDLLRAVVSPDRPLVMVVDDLQWASSIPAGFVDAVLRDENLTGLLIVGAYREAEVDAAHPWSAMLARWDRLGCAPPRLHLRNLPAADLAALLIEMMRLPADEAARLAAEVSGRTDGNPYDTVELVNALRRDGVLVPGDTGWSWNAEALRCFVGEGDVVDLLAARMERLPAPAVALLEIMACLGNETDLELLRAAVAEPDATVAGWLAPSLEDGLLVLERPVGQDAGGGTVRFRHDRVQQAAYGRLRPDRRAALQLTLARRLAEHPGFALIAAQQYLPVVAGVAELAERRQVVGLFRMTAARTHLINYAATEQFLAASVRLLTEAGVDPDDPLLAQVQPEWHAALYALGRLADADAVYRAIEHRAPDPIALTPSACVQISSLTSRGLTLEAVTLGLDLLRRLGLRVPAPGDLGAQVERGLDALYEWAAGADREADARRAEISDPRVVSTAKIINRMMPPAFFSDPVVLGWLVTAAHRIWVEHGPHAALVCPLGHAGIVTTNRRQDYRTGYGTVRRVLEAGEQRGYEPETSQARFLFAVSVGHWFEPLEDVIQHARQAHEGLVRAGDLLFACFTYHASTPSMLDCASTLDGYAVEVEAGLAFAARTGNEQTSATSLPFRQLLRALRGETVDPGEEVATFDDPAYLAEIDAHPMAVAYHHITVAQAAALFGDADTLDRHSAEAMPLLPFIQASYSTARAYLLRALALANRVRAVGADARTAELGELDACREWLAQRAGDAQATFGHLLRLVDAERAWAVGEPHDAAVAFDAALEEVARRRFPWHQALIAERAGVFHLSNGMEHTGRTLLAEAVRHFGSWGAEAKVRQLRLAYPFLAGLAEGPARRSGPATTTRVSVESIDLLAVLNASQALSSETSLDRLRVRVVEVLRNLAGASKVHLLLHSDDATGWVLLDDGTGNAVPVQEAGERGLLPLTAFRYAERTREPLLVEDATRDDRLSRDPYVAALDRCSLLVVPILSQGVARAMVLLENRLSRNMFTAERLDAVGLIAGQLAVSLDNARLYSSLERKVAERTAELETANEQLQKLSVTDALTGLANRRQLADLLEAEWQRGRRRGEPLAVAMIDIDHFKLYNDHYGHLIGDTCLRRVAAAINETVRTNDAVARYGGEEFAIVLPGGDTAAAGRVADRVREAVEALAEPHAAASSGIVTVSIGVASTVPSAQHTPEELVAAADVQLYRAKRNGRNQVARDEVVHPR